MKSLKIFTLITVVLSLASCSITEKMIINENGTGKFAYEIDGSKMMSMMGSALKNDESNSKKKKSKKNKSETVISKRIDSTFTFKELFADKKDSIAKLPIAEQQKIKKMEKFSIRMIMDEEKGTMYYNMFTDFASVSELDDVMSPVESMKNISPSSQQAGGLAMAPTDLEDNSSTSFFYNGKTFKKIVAKKIEENIEIDSVGNSEKSSEENELGDKMKESFEMFYAQSNFKVVYEFPKAVKKVSISNALYNEDRKTITIEYPLKEYMENPTALNFEVEFE